MIKLVLFCAMVALASLNRFRLTPALGVQLELPNIARSAATLHAVTRSVGIESGAAAAILGVVAWLGTLAPPAAA